MCETASASAWKWQTRNRHLKVTMGKDAEEGAESKQFVYYVLPEAFRREICKGFDPGMVARALRDQEHLESNEKTA